MEKRIIGVTGGVGAGKSRVLKILAGDFGAHVIQADEVAKALMEPGQECYRRGGGDLGWLFYTSDAAGGLPCLDFWGGRVLLKKKKKK